jgi:hypothetical protein
LYEHEVISLLQAQKVTKRTKRQQHSHSAEPEHKVRGAKLNGSCGTIIINFAVTLKHASHQLFTFTGNSAAALAAEFGQLGLSGKVKKDMIDAQALEDSESEHDDVTNAQCLEDRDASDGQPVATSVNRTSSPAPHRPLLTRKEVVELLSGVYHCAASACSHVGVKSADA